MIKAEKITVSYGDFKALNNITVEIQSHKVTAILGENGSGKSTLLNLFARLREPDGGSITLNESPIQEDSHMAFAKKVACLKQTNSINLKLTVRELVSFGRFPHNPHKLTADDHKKIDEALMIMGCEDIAEKSLRALSGGQRQRVFVAMVLAQDTEVILLDEPLNNLDVRHAHELMGCIRKLVDEHNKTVVIVLHDINMVYRYADDVVCLRSGMLINQGSVCDVLTTDTLARMYDMNFKINEDTSPMYCVVE